MVLKQSSLQRVFLVPFILLMVCVGLTVIGVLYQAGKDATNAIAQKALVDTSSRVYQATERHLSSAGITLKSIVPEPVMLATGMVPPALPFPDELKKIEERLWIATDLFPDVTRYAYFAGEDGRFVGINRSDPDAVELRTKEAGSNMRRFFSMTGPLSPRYFLRSDEYEPKKRAWYQEAVNRQGRTWLPPHTDPISRELLLTLSKPVYRDDRSLSGVVATDLSLEYLNMFLQSLTVSENGVVFIAERTGGLIATSTREQSFPPLQADASMQLQAEKSTVPLIREAYEDITQTLRDRGGVDRFLMHQFDGSSGRTQVAAMTLQDEAGLDWLIVVAVPRSDFMSSVSGNLYRGLAVGLAAMFVALVLGFLILQWALRDIRKLTLAAKSIGSGEPFEPLNIDRDDEIGQLAQSFEEMERNLRTDRLTHVLNRESLIAQIDFRRQNASAANPLRFALLFIDLDKFKRINDVFGHESGDRVLIQSAARLQDTLRREDAVARFGGDEFVVYLHGVDSDDVVHSMSEKIRMLLEQPIAVSDDAMENVGASIGYARYPAEGADIETLFKLADERMFEAKRARKAEDNGDNTHGIDSR